MLRTQLTFNGIYPLHLACAKGSSLHVIQRLLIGYPNASCCSRRAVLFRRKVDGLLPLHLAAKNCCADVVKLVLAAFPDGASKTAAGDDSSRVYLPLHFCFLNPKSTPEMVDVLLEAYPQAMHDTVATGDQTAAAIKLFNNPPLQLALRFASAEVVSHLLQRFPQIARTLSDDSGSLLHSALAPTGDFTGIDRSDSQHQQVVGLLLNLDPQAIVRVDKSGNLPLHLALYHGSCVGVIDILLTANPDSLKVRNAHGDAALRTACRYAESGEVIKRILSADPASAAE